MLEIKPHSTGAILPVWAQPGARKNMVVGTHNGMLRVAVTAAPEQGKANKAIVEVIRKKLRVPKSAVELVAGTTSRRKEFLIQGLSAEELVARLETILEDS